ncbi:MAG TPA: PepSY-associated TM helix domain-containing protein [Blastocatellia bacterium]|nr:PepSY-associated TM helix domain-containing protein [Blastocatellia bacterium]
MRTWMLRAHRYAGLTLAGFLVIIGLTGSVIAFFNELDARFNPELLTVKPEGKPIPLLELREKLEAQDPRSHVYYLHFPESPDQSVSAYAEGAIDPKTGEPHPLNYDEVFANPYSGERLGERHWGNFSFERKDLLTSLYYLHYSLVLPEALGEGFMGFVALFWAIDCFVGLYLTLPARRKDGNGSIKSYWKRWFQSWRIRTNAGSKRLIFDFHIAVSLSVWLMLLLFALSGFSFNLPDAYASVMRRVTNFEDLDRRPELEKPLSKPAIGWEQALQLGREYMDEQARLHGFTINRPASLIYRRQTGVFYYRVHSSRDLVRYGATSVAIDATTGNLLGVEIPTGHRPGNTFTSWIASIHMAMVGGVPMKIFVSCMGMVVVALSITGVLIWWRIRRPFRRPWIVRVMRNLRRDAASPPSHPV